MTALEKTGYMNRKAGMLLNCKFRYKNLKSQKRSNKREKKKEVSWKNEGLERRVLKCVKIQR